MGRYKTGSQTRVVMAQKEELAIQLLERGLSVKQVAAQLRCSAFFVRKVRNAIGLRLTA